jgi:Copper type II ascorbate-dependent monooxygenase, C-terminal domain
VAFRLAKGNSLMLSTHFLNTTDSTIDGHAVVDIKFAEVDPARPIATMFVNGSARFQVPANGSADALAECVVKDPMQIIMFTNHMHDHGASAITEIVHADGSVELAHEDPEWTYEMQFKAVYSKWPVDAPLLLEPGDIVRTRCHWQNKTADDVHFPREMCFGIGFFLADGNSSPTCLDGQWQGE